MEILPEASAITDAIAKNDPTSLIVAVKEYARLTRNPYNSDAHICLGPSIPVSPNMEIHYGWQTEDEDMPALQNDGLQNERVWIRDLFYTTGNDCQKQHRYDLALLCYKEAFKYSPAPSVFNNMAAVYKRMGDYVAAVECHQQNISYFPNYVPAYGRLAILLSAYSCNAELLPLEYLRTYFAKGGNRTQLQAFVTGLPAQEAEALDGLLEKMAADEVQHFKRQKSKSKSSKPFKYPFGRS